MSDDQCTKFILKAPEEEFEFVFESLPPSVQYVQINHAHLESIPLPPDQNEIVFLDLTDNPEIQLEDDMVELELYPQLKYLFMDPQLLSGRNQIIASVCTNIVQINDTLIN